MNTNKKYKKVVYLHGLESPQGGPKVNYLSSKYMVYAPKMNYFENPENIFSEQLKTIKDFEPDIIIGSSMGGYFADRIASHIGCETLLFNPGTVKAGDFEKEYGLKTVKGNKQSNKKIIIGLSDDVVDPIKSLKHYQKSKAQIHAFEGLEHRIPEDFFISQIERFYEK